MEKANKLFSILNKDLTKLPLLTKNKINDIIKKDKMSKKISFIKGYNIWVNVK